jgi:AraC family transcriptional regulator
MELSRSVSLTNIGRWSRAAVEEWRQNAPGEYAEGFLLQHVLAIHTGPPTTIEVRRSGEGWKRYSTNFLTVQLVPAMVPHTITWNRATTTVVATIAPELLNNLAGGSSRRFIELRPVDAVQDPVISNLVCALRDDARDGCPFGSIYGESLSAALAAHLLRRYSLGGVGPAIDSIKSGRVAADTFKGVLDYINEHVESQLPLHEIAKLVGMDVYRFIRAFTHSVGTSPHHYIIERRIDVSKDLLKNTELSLGVIAHRCGFATASHFTNTFRRLTGVTPRLYRQRFRSVRTE